MRRRVVAACALTPTAIYFPGAQQLLDGVAGESECDGCSRSIKQRTLVTWLSSSLSHYGFSEGAEDEGNEMVTSD